MNILRISVAACVLGSVPFLCQPAQGQNVSFRSQVAPILVNNCLACHGPKKAEGGYRVDNFERLMAAGESGSHGFSPKAVDASEGFRRIVSSDASERMPLEGDPLPADQVELIKKWIEEGATFDGPDPKANLATVIPPPVHPDPPAEYPHAMPVTAITFSPDGSEVIVGGYNELTLWNAANGQLNRRWKNVGQRTFALAFSPDGKSLAVGGGTPGRLGEVRVFDFATGNLKAVLGTTSDVVLDVSYSPQGDRIAIGAADGVLRIVESESGKELFAINSHSDWVTATAWNADGTKLASVSRDKTAKVFDSKTGELAVTYSGHGQPVRGIAFHPDGAELFSAGNDKKIHRWKLADGAKTAEVAFGDEVYKLPLGGGFLFASSADKSLRQFDAKTHGQIRAFAGPTDSVLCAAYHDGTKRVAGGVFSGGVHVWNLADGNAIATFIAAPGLKQ
ncbi:MAG: hypothetical protein FJ295_09775 [Planctomycetes bacterium]|nr:hypothetical protein [Planctomycetota bacterium]